MLYTTHPPARKRTENDADPPAPHVRRDALRPLFELRPERAVVSAPRIALVTGGGSGMGRRWTERMVAAGTKVAALDRDAAALEKAWAGNPSVRTFACDVTDLEGVKKIVEQVERELGPIDRVVHAAGIMPGSPLVEDDPERTKRVMRINFEGTVNLVHATLPKLLGRRSGEFVAFGSVAGEALTPRLGAYCASKAAVNAYMEILAHENLDKGVTIHLVCPPMVDTPLLEQSMGSGGPFSLKKAIDEKMLAKPDEVIDGVEAALAKKKHVSHPLVASKALSLMRRYVPGLLWSVIDRAEKEMAAKG